MSPRAKVKAGGILRTSADTIDVVSRFWPKVDKRGPEECWPWKAGADPRGYGWMRVGPRMEHSNRVSWRIHFGEPGELCVLHRCDNPRCVNPAHLFLGTKGDNNRDRHEKGRSRGGSRPGTENPAAKLTPEKVREIRERRANGERWCDLARAFGVARETIRDVVRGRLWAWVS